MTKTTFLKKNLVRLTRFNVKANGRLAPKFRVRGVSDWISMPTFWKYEKYEHFKIDETCESFRLLFGPVFNCSILGAWFVMRQQNGTTQVNKINKSTAYAMHEVLGNTERDK